MDDIDQVAVRIFQEFAARLEEAGLSIDKIDEETGQLRIPTPGGQAMLVSLQNLIQYYYESRDENAVSDFVAKVAAAARPPENPDWEEARQNVYVSLFPSNAQVDNPLARTVTSYFNRFVILDTPSQSIWVMPETLEYWGVSAEEVERRAMENGDRLLAETELEIGDVEGHPLGSFQVRDRTLTAALLFAPSLKAKVEREFGWPIYAVIPDKVTCYFFGRGHYDYFAERLGDLVADKYESSRQVTPELLEFGDCGVRSIWGWTKKLGYVIKFDS